ncbi:MAG: hypothetical protein ACLUUO_07695 [Sellimonas intestinalis]
MSQTPIFHGSDLEQIASYYHIESDEICCFSAKCQILLVFLNRQLWLSARIFLI